MFAYAFVFCPIFIFYMLMNIFEFLHFSIGIILNHALLLFKMNSTCETLDYIFVLPDSLLSTLFLLELLIDLLLTSFSIKDALWCILKKLLPEGVTE